MTTTTESFNDKVKPESKKPIIFSTTVIKGTLKNGEDGKYEITKHNI